MNIFENINNNDEKEENKIFENKNKFNETAQLATMNSFLSRTHTHTHTHTHTLDNMCFFIFDDDIASSFIQPSLHPLIHPPIHPSFLQSHSLDLSVYEPIGPSHTHIHTHTHIHAAHTHTHTYICNNEHTRTKTTKNSIYIYIYILHNININIYLLT
eukprot:GHVR01053211.1.p1 GENE.GHVR01053211.1~~GHVR01053211.1.p1  ORF type:complete len:157 (-),score=90.03 GHVR01053211.1:121-591(-)